ncbi:glycosyltransferase family 4 protein [bacterium]|nr:glycosyltransferase family 4 protein [bacterium]
MRVGIDARYLNESYSGIAKYSANLLTALSRIDTKNEYVVFIHPTFNRRLKVGDNFRVVTYPARPLSMRTLLSFGNRIRRTGCQFLHSLSPVAPLYGIKGQILTIHDLQPFTFQDETVYGLRPAHNTLATLFYRTTFPHFVRSATWMISVSQATKDRLTSIYPEAQHKTIVIHSGVEETYFEPPEPTIAQMVKKKLKLPEHFILYIGSAQPSKNLPAMIRAFARCRQSHPDRLGDLHFILVVGRDRYSSECARIVRQQQLGDHVHLLGPITEEEKIVLYSKARLLFSVTRGEGFGFPIVEAQAAGLPVLAGDDASVPEVTGNSALLVNPDDEDQITHALADVLLDEALRQQFVEAGRTNVRRFSWDESARKVLQVYQLLM